MAVAIMDGKPHYIRRGGVEARAGNGSVRFGFWNVTNLSRRGSRDGGWKKTLPGRISKQAAEVLMMVGRKMDSRDVVKRRWQP
jgi:hypothetical protein